MKSHSPSGSAPSTQSPQRLWLPFVVVVVIYASTFTYASAAYSEWSTTCGIGNPPDQEFGHEGINVKTNDHFENDVRVCEWLLVHPDHYVTWYIKVEVRNATETGLPCDSSEQLFVGEADDPSTMERLCGPMTFSKIYPSSVTIQIRGDNGAEISDIVMDVSLEEVEYLKTCNSTSYQEERTIDIVKTLDPDDHLFLPYNCYWKFHTPSQFNKLIVEVHSVDLIGQDNSQDCQNNSLIIIDGWERDHAQVYKTCHSNSGFTFTTSENSALVLVMVAEHQTQDDNLAFNFSVTPFSITQCYGQVLTLTASSDSKFLTSPGYPDKYYRRLNCLWKIESEDGNEIEIVFEDADLNAYDCDNDYVNVYDGPTTSSLRIANECHDWKNERHKYRSSGQALLIQLRADDYNTEGKGVNIRYYTQEEPSPDLVPDTQCRENIIHLKATKDDKYLTSVNYPNSFPSNSLCRWVLHSDNDNIEVEVVDLEVDGDVLEIYGGTNTDVSPLASLHNDVISSDPAPKYRSQGQGRSMLIQFRTDESVGNKGWRLRYYTRADPSPDLTDVNECRGKIVYLNSTEEMQNFTSAGYLHSYPPLSDCRWQIFTESDTNIIKMDILFIEMMQNVQGSNCDLDYVEMFDGPNVTSPSLGRWCSDSTPTPTPSMESSGPYLTVKFISNDEGSGKGFNIQYYSQLAEVTTDPTTTDKNNQGGPSDHSPKTSANVYTIVILLSAFLLAVVKG